MSLEYQFASLLLQLTEEYKINDPNFSNMRNRYDADTYKNNELYKINGSFKQSLGLQQKVKPHEVESFGSGIIQEDNSVVKLFRKCMYLRKNIRKARNAIAEVETTNAVLNKQNNVLVKVVNAIMPKYKSQVDSITNKTGNEVEVQKFVANAFSKDNIPIPEDVKQKINDKLDKVQNVEIAEIKVDDLNIAKPIVKTGDIFVNLATAEATKNNVLIAEAKDAINDEYTDEITEYAHGVSEVLKSTFNGYPDATKNVTLPNYDIIELVDLTKKDIQDRATKNNVTETVADSDYIYLETYTIATKGEFIRLIKNKSYPLTKQGCDKLFNEFKLFIDYVADEIMDNRNKVKPTVDPDMVKVIDDAVSVNITKITNKINSGIVNQSDNADFRISVANLKYDAGDGKGVRSDEVILKELIDDIATKCFYQVKARLETDTTANVVKSNKTYEDDVEACMSKNDALLAGVNIARNDALALFRKGAVDLTKINAYIDAEVRKMINALNAGITDPTHSAGIGKSVAGMSYIVDGTTYTDKELLDGIFIEHPKTCKKEVLNAYNADKTQNEAYYMQFAKDCMIEQDYVERVANIKKSRDVALAKLGGKTPQEKEQEYYNAQIKIIDDKYNKILTNAGAIDAKIKADKAAINHINSLNQQKLDEVITNYKNSIKSIYVATERDNKLNSLETVFNTRITNAIATINAGFPANQYPMTGIPHPLGGKDIPEEDFVNSDNMLSILGLFSVDGKDKGELDTEINAIEQQGNNLIDDYFAAVKLHRDALKPKDLKASDEDVLKDTDPTQENAAYTTTVAVADALEIILDDPNQKDAFIAEMLDRAYDDDIIKRLKFRFWEKGKHDLLKNYIKSHKDTAAVAARMGLTMAGGGRKSNVSDEDYMKYLKYKTKYIVKSGKVEKKIERLLLKR